MTTRAPSTRIHRPPTPASPWPLKHIKLGIEILTEIARFGFLTNSQIRDLFFADLPNRQGEPRTAQGAQSASGRSLRQLWENGYLERVRVVLTSRRTAGGYIAFVNVLSARGLDSVQQYLAEIGTPLELRAKPGDPELSLQQLEHRVALYDLYALFRRGFRLQGLKMPSWLDDRQLATLRTKGATRLLNVPDAAFVVGRAPADAKGFFVELDLGTESVSGRSDRRRDWQGKIEAYERYFATAARDDALIAGLPRPVVLTVTTSERRLVNMLEATRQAGGGGDYWYTTREELDPPPLDRRTWNALSPDERTRQSEALWLRRRESVWQPIWRVCSDGTRRSLSRLLIAPGV
jgi:hypothetical protein